MNYVNNHTSTTVPRIKKWFNNKNRAIRIDKQDGIYNGTYNDNYGYIKNEILCEKFAWDKDDPINNERIEKIFSKIETDLSSGIKEILDINFWKTKYPRICNLHTIESRRIFTVLTMYTFILASKSKYMRKTMNSDENYWNEFNNYLKAIEYFIDIKEKNEEDAYIYWWSFIETVFQGNVIHNYQIMSKPLFALSDTSVGFSSEMSYIVINPNVVWFFAKEHSKTIKKVAPNPIPFLMEMIKAHDYDNIYVHTDCPKKASDIYKQAFGNKCYQEFQKENGIKKSKGE